MAFILFIFINILSNHTNFQASNNSLIVDIKDFKSNKGQVIVALHNSEDNFPISFFKKEFKNIKDKKSKIVFKNIPNGNYAVTVIHDKNKNGKLDFNFLHFPTEKTGVSNDGKGFLGMPKFKNAMFVIDQDKEITISLK